MKRIAINGIGRIGRTSLKIILDTPGLELVAVNDIAPIDNIAYLIKYDSVHGTYNKDIEIEPNLLTIDSHPIQFFSERDPEKLPWKDLNIDVVIESTGLFTNREDAEIHI